MDQVSPRKTSTRECGFAPIRVSTATHKILQHLMVRANDKDLGRKVRADEIVNVALFLVLHEHIDQLQAATFSNADRLELSYRRFIMTGPKITKDEFLGRILNGEAVTTPTI